MNCPFVEKSCIRAMIFGGGIIGVLWRGSIIVLLEKSGGQESISFTFDDDDDADDDC